MTAPRQWHAHDCPGQFTNRECCAEYRRFRDIRAANILAMRRSGATLYEIGEAFYLSRERVRQILCRVRTGRKS